MSKKLQRVFRERPLTPEEVAADQVVREQLMQEFPPKSTSVEGGPDSLSELLRKSIRESNRTFEHIAADAGVSHAVVISFVSGERDIHMATADKLARALGLEVTSE